MKQCPHCKTIYSDDTPYCLKDNYRLKYLNNENLKTSSDDSVNTKIIICPNCGYKNKVITINGISDTKQCYQCSMDLNYNKTHQAHTIKNNRNPNIYEKQLQTQEQNIPKCPTCGSTNINKISAGKKAAGFLTIGIFSSNFSKTMECKNCGYKW